MEIQGLSGHVEMCSVISKAMFHMNTSPVNIFSETCPSKCNVWHMLTYYVLYKALILYTTTYNPFGHARGSGRCFSMTYDHLGLT